MAASEGWAPCPCAGPMALLSPAGLSSESWSIMKNMATELGIILIGYFTLVPAIQVRPQGLPVRGYPSAQTPWPWDLCCPDAVPCTECSWQAWFRSSTSSSQTCFSFLKQKPCAALALPSFLGLARTHLCSSRHKPPPTIGGPPPTAPSGSCSWPSAPKQLWGCEQVEGDRRRVGAQT